MSKTIEELAEQYVKDVYNGDTDFIDETESVLTWIFNKPLTQRLTDEDKERVMKTYKVMSDYGKKKDVMCADCANYVARVGLERIFGKEFFKEGKL